MPLIPHHLELIATSSITLGWPLASAFAGIVMSVVYVSGMVVKALAARMKSSSDEHHESDLIRIALFGRAADPPLEAITGLIADNKDTKVAITSLKTEVANLRTDVRELLARTTENGGSSLKDQLNRIEKTTQGGVHA